MSLELSIGRQMVLPNVGFVWRFCSGAASARVVSRGHATVRDVPVERFRIEIVGGGVSYIDLVLGRVRDRVVVVDAFLSAQDTWLSLQVRDSAVPLGGTDTPWPACVRAVPVRRFTSWTG